MTPFDGKSKSINVVFYIIELALTVSDIWNVLF